MISFPKINPGISRILKKLNHPHTIKQENTEWINRIQLKAEVLEEVPKGKSTMTKVWDQLKKVS